MYYYLKNIYNYINLITNIVYVYNYSIDLNKNLILLDKIKSNIDCIGGIGIKCIQWFMPYYKLIHPNDNITNKFKVYFDDCSKHDIKYTEYIYNKSFNHSIYDKYNIIKLLGSGSIGQVYLIKDKKTSKQYAIKILHPNINIQIFIFKLLYNIIKHFINFNKYIPVNNIDKLVNNLILQLDLNNEYNNNVLFHKLYSDNKYIIIPKIYEHTKDLLIMDYIDGIKYDINNDIIINNRYNIIKILSVFMENNSMFNIMHGDLHEGNWCIDVNDNDGKIKLIIYDYGFCFDICDEEYNILINLFTSEKKIESTENLLKFYLYNECNNHIDDKIKNDLIINFKKTEDFNNNVLCAVNVNDHIIKETEDEINLVKLIPCLIKYLIKHNINISPTLLNGLILFLQLIGYYGNNCDSVGVLGYKLYNTTILNFLNEYNMCYKLKENKKKVCYNMKSSFDKNFNKFNNLKKFI